MPARIHIVGASSSGTTTLGMALAARLGAAHLDTDSFFWEATDPLFTAKRPEAERVALMEAALAGAEAWVISGSLIGWGDVFVPRFDLVVFLHVPHEVRMARLMARERERYGAAIEPGGAMHAAHLEFLAWAHDGVRECPRLQRFVQEDDVVFVDAADLPDRVAVEIVELRAAVREIRLVHDVVAVTHFLELLPA